MTNLSQEALDNKTASGPSAAKIDFKFEIVVIPVSDVDRAKKFYASLGWRFNIDSDSKDHRLVQFTPPGSGCSIIFGRNVTDAAPGYAQGLYLVVSDIEAARKDLLHRGVEISETFHGDSGVYDGPDEPYLFGRCRVNGPDPTHRSYGSFASFQDPDSNRWILREVTTRLPGHMDPQRQTLYPSTIWLAHCGIQRSRTVIIRSVSDRLTRTDRTGTPSSWCANRPVKSATVKHLDTIRWEGKHTRANKSEGFKFWHV